MAVSANVLRVSTTLRLGERVLVRCDDGLLSTEYGLFDSADIVLRATDPVTVRETGYITTARDAIARLARAGITPELAAEAVRSISAEVARSFARTGDTSSIAAIYSHLGACELFDGAVYRAATETYEGTWLDLHAVSAALGRADAGAVLQALHLAAALDEVARSTPVHLATANATRERRPGERTHRRVHFEGARDVLAELRRLQPNRSAPAADPQRDRVVIDGLLTRVRARASADAAPTLRAHLAKLETGLTSSESPAPGPLADPELWAIEQQLTAGDASGVQERLDALERTRGRSAALRYLRARAALVAGDEPPNSVAQVLTAIANEDRGFHEAELVAARAWLAAGEEAYARHFARRLAEDVTARDSARLVALEILDATGANNRSQAPPPAVAVSAQASPAAAPAGQPAAAAPRTPAPPAHSTLVIRPSVATADAPVEVASEVVVEARPPPPPIRYIPAGASLPPTATVPPAAPAPEARPVARPVGPGRYDPELVESLALPLGGSEEILAVGDWPTTPLQARTAMTRLARSLARDYRLWYGSTLRCNVLAVDAMQRHLTQRYVGANLADAKVISELQRHGALLSEIFARAFAGDWVDIAPTEPGYWAMLVPPITRCWPIGRVYRFVSLGRKERDLVSYYLDIETRTRT